MKQLLEKKSDLGLAMLVCRSTPLESGYSPSELWGSDGAFSEPSLPDASLVRTKERKLKERMKRNFREHHRAKN